MKYVYMATLALCILCTGCSKQPDSAASSEHPHITFWERQYRSGDSLWYVCYGTCSENSVTDLTFVLFESGSLDDPPGIRRVVTRELNPPKQEGFLIASYKGMIQLPTDTQLYEIANRQLSSSPERVSLAQIKGYLESEPNEYTLESLLAHSKAN